MPLAGRPERCRASSSGSSETRLRRAVAAERPDAAGPAAQLERDRGSGPVRTEIADDLADDVVVVSVEDELPVGGPADLQPVHPGVPRGQHVEHVPEIRFGQRRFGEEPAARRTADQPRQAASPAYGGRTESVHPFDDDARRADRLHRRSGPGCDRRARSGWDSGAGRARVGAVADRTGPVPPTGHRHGRPDHGRTNRRTSSAATTHGGEDRRRCRSSLGPPPRRRLPPGPDPAA